MNKAILVIDMPSCCDECFALDDNEDIILEQENRRWVGVH